MTTFDRVTYMAIGLLVLVSAVSAACVPILAVAALLKWILS